MNSHDAPRERIRATTESTLCWKCSKPYLVSVKECPYCHAANGNVDLEKAQGQVSEKGTNNAAPQEGTERLTAPGHAGDEYTEARSPVGAAPHPSQPAAEGTPRTDAVCTPQSLAAILNASKLECALLTLARTLERELDEAKEIRIVLQAQADRAEGLIVAAESRLSALEADAQRYRWWREDLAGLTWYDADMGNIAPSGTDVEDIMTGEMLDAAIDARIAKEKA